MQDAIMPYIKNGALFSYNEVVLQTMLCGSSDAAVRREQDAGAETRQTGDTSARTTRKPALNI
ncbi:MAG: hypothetical protein OIF55_18230, partial [Amphritea sp.]|nr:hypothetical protein [Amphritea sp.]